MKARRQVPTPWMNSAEAARYANSRGFPTVTRETIRLHAGAELLRAYTAGKHQIRVRIEDVDHWLDTRPWNQYRDGDP
ncbi:hypothetical protein [Mycolicibacterium porcinum]|uniref:hypothetical protein n=1 Tax=Mycolicibacterium porcinum TaxID=39693 RepID=UPI0008489171|nr:hypothetical protein [Mycolicibacterium porcinum]ODR17595.1 hypothetical protein BHQ19_28570 [Mycolicibacterium porcinum]